MAVGPNAQTATVTAVDTSTTSATLSGALGTGAVRIIDNSSAATLYIRFGTTAASATDFSFALITNTTWHAPDNAYAGPIQGILSAGTGSARVTSY